MFESFAWFKKPTEEDLENIRAIKRYKTMRIVGDWGIAVDPEEIANSPEFKEHKRKIRELIFK
ncbi:hypothetical protein HX875_27575 [Pseudomonas yamanorum]|jgi:hypothetical protein|uniref:Uncharacterized protein n=1 Tax=Pseudomonas yamanorum TaxID=515393 RepID=A0A7Y8K3Z9_9PSED|nr:MULTISPECIES: hypothetical protein [Pseudomonas]MCS3419342.1 hypothetical protein [Pseudomonas sp. BIGb0558]MCS3438286.1 hypothetical protein [Pseudomonas sp. BIGb0450]NVZ86023.1 hypothetical protein [Pseudomonas yamanorum]NWD24211.1 hypothetical protein [Pseudomonas yamanorum]NWE15062.1 hypothetical protein [Pseudomonas yamanorum]